MTKAKQDFPFPKRLCKIYGFNLESSILRTQLHKMKLWLFQKLRKYLKKSLI